MEFVRRFLQHVLPRGFVKIRHYGLSASVHTRTKHVVAYQLLGPLPDFDVAADGVDGEHDGDVLIAVGVYVALLARTEAVPCPRCHTGRLLISDKGPDPP